jgi:hypothetical protein
MSIPTPSFFKIRLFLIISIIILFCFFVGFMKSAFAVDIAWKPTKAGCVSKDGYSSGYYDVEAVGSGPEIYITQTNYSGLNAWNPYKTLQLCVYAVYAKQDFGDGTCQWYKLRSNQFLASVNTPAFDGIPDLERGLCGPPCEIERAQVIDLCGGDDYVDWSNWSDETCSGGKCVPPCDQPGQETQNQAIGRCVVAGKSLVYYDAENCRGVCGCSEDVYREEKAKCSPFTLINFNEVTCKGDCGLEKAGNFGRPCSN